MVEQLGHRRIRRLPLALVAMLGLLAAACADDGPVVGATRSGFQPTPGEVTVVGEDNLFDVTLLSAAVGEPLTITFENRDEGIQHNFHVEGTADGDVATPIQLGPVTQELTVTFGDTGEFEYECEVHPDTMRGTITVPG